MDKPTVPSGEERPTPEPAPRPTRQADRAAVWLQFPRRLILLPLALGGALGLLLALRLPLGSGLSRGAPADWSHSWLTGQPVTEIILERLPHTLLLVGAAVLLAGLISLGLTIVALLVHRLEKRAGPVGSVLKGAGRLLAFADATPPVIGLGILFILVFAIRLGLLPAGGMLDPVGGGGVLDRLAHLVLPAAVLALLPALLTAQAVTREVTLPRERSGVRLWMQGLCRALGVLAGQTGGLLGASLLVEMVFNWPGIGSVAFRAAGQGDFAVFLGGLIVYTILGTGGRLVAEFFCWLERLLKEPLLSPAPEPSRWRKTAHRIWLILALLLLLAPLGLAIAGLAMGQDAISQTDPAHSTEPPSGDHPWGTDRLGRDVQARTLRGASLLLGTAIGVALLVLLLSGPGGALSGFLSRRRTWWSESLADLLLLPADALLLIPAIPAALAVMLTTGEPQAGLVALAAAVVLLPRSIRLCQTLWTAAPEQRPRATLWLAGVGAVLLGNLFGALILISALDFSGLGTPPPTPALGGLLQAGAMAMIREPSQALAAILTLWVCTFTTYTAADALVGLFRTKEAMVRLNE